MKLNEQLACQQLGLTAPSSIKQARKAYRALARKLHPDVGGDEERFKMVSSAYQYLVDLYEDNPNRKRPIKEQEENADHREAWRAWRSKTSGDKHKAYGTHRDDKDAYHASTNQSSADSSTYSAHQGSTYQESPEVVEVSVVPSWREKIEEFGRLAGEKVSGVSDKVSSKLSRWYRDKTKGLYERGKDESLKLELDLNTLIYGRQQRIAIHRLIPCPQCQMEGIKKIVEDQVSAISRARDCMICKGEARISQRDEISVYVPPGGDQGHKLKVTGKGRAGLNSSPDGDLYLILSPPSLPVGFRRKGPLLYLELAVPKAVMTPGGPVSISTPRGLLSINIPKHSISGRKLVVTGQGFNEWGSDQIGDLIITLRERA